MELMRERVESEAEAILAPYFDALARGGDVEQRMRAAERLLDRVFGRPKQSAELSGALTLDERTLEAELEQELEALMAARRRNELAAVTAALHAMPTTSHSRCASTPGASGCAGCVSARG